MDRVSPKTAEVCPPETGTGGTGGASSSGGAAGASTGGASAGGAAGGAVAAGGAAGAVASGGAGAAYGAPTTSTNSGCGCRTAGCFRSGARARCGGDGRVRRRAAPQAPAQLKFRPRSDRGAVVDAAVLGSARSARRPSVMRSRVRSRSLRLSKSTSVGSMGAGCGRARAAAR